jgi:hypothetical protein
MQHMKTVFLGTYHWTRFKYYQWLTGGNGGLTRQPSMKMHRHEMEMTKAALFQIGIQPRQTDDEFFTGRVNFEKSNHLNGKKGYPHGPMPPKRV